MRDPPRYTGAEEAEETAGIENKSLASKKLAL